MDRAGFFDNIGGNDCNGCNYYSDFSAVVGNDGWIFASGRAFAAVRDRWSNQKKVGDAVALRGRSSKNEGV
jgi:hypothetical protein